MGSPLKQIKSALLKRGLILQAGYGIIMPRSFIVEYGALSEQKQIHLFNKAKEKTQRIIQDISSQKRRDLDNRFNILDKIIFKFFYYKNTSKIKSSDSNYWVKDNCLACGKCVRLCPAGNIELVGNKPTWKHNCLMCVRCIQSCPQNAIEYGEITRERNRYLNPIFHTKFK